MAFDVDQLIEELADRIVAKLAAKSNGHSAGPRLLTVDQAAEYLGRTEQAMYQLISHKKLPTVRTDRRVMIDIEDLKRWIEENKRC
jgi:excisionase family DNA binding protein